MKNKDVFFQGINKELQQYSRAIPSLIIDLDILDKNIDQLIQSISKDVNFRIVVKSLPSQDLVQYIRSKTETHALQVFHQPFLSQLIQSADTKIDILLGKPMPIQTAAFVYDSLGQQSQTSDPFTQIQWLVDTEARLKQYKNLALQLGAKLRLNLEIDVGLRRGGFKDLKSLHSALSLCQECRDSIEFSGFMGYDPHIVKLPRIVRSPAKSLRLATTFYHQCKELVKKEFPSLWNDKLTFNGAGSPTMTMHKPEASPLNDISAGSCLVKPTSFDIPTLSDFFPASFIAAPVLKVLEGTSLPGLESMKSVFNFFKPSFKQSCFIYGGFWKADYVYPDGLSQNKLFGPSTNQTMLNAPLSTILNVDDFVFLRPHQSEFVFLQFGNILVMRNGKIVDEWAPLSN